jgi:hypothetical protein
MTNRNPPSWTVELAHEHAQLGNLLGRVRRLMDAKSEETRDGMLGVLLEQLTVEVREHMEFEERDGYLAPVQQRMPGLFDTIERMRGEHAVLQSKLAQILTDARTRPGVYEFREEVSPHVRQWLDSMRDHERRENLLVQEAFNTDISTGD